MSTVSAHTVPVALDNLGFVDAVHQDRFGRGVVECDGRHDPPIAGANRDDSACTPHQFGTALVRRAGQADDVTDSKRQGEPDDHVNWRLRPTRS